MTMFWGARGAFSPDGETLAVAMNDGMGRVQWWNLATHKVVKTAPVKESVFLNLGYHPNGDLLASSNRLQTLIINREGETVFVFRNDALLGFADEGKRMLTVGMDAQMNTLFRVWDYHNRRKLEETKVMGDDVPEAVYPDGSRVITVNNGVASGWDIRPKNKR
jgi:WD40 repeat protein